MALVWRSWSRARWLASTCVTGSLTPLSSASGPGGARPRPEQLAKGARGPGRGSGARGAPRQKPRSLAARGAGMAAPARPLVHEPVRGGSGGGRRGGAGGGGGGGGRRAAMADGARGTSPAPGLAPPHPIGRGGSLHLHSPHDPPPVLPPRPYTTFFYTHVLTLSACFDMYPPRLVPGVPGYPPPPPGIPNREARQSTGRPPGDLAAGGRVWIGPAALPPAHWPGPPPGGHVGYLAGAPRWDNGGMTPG